MTPVAPANDSGGTRARFRVLLERLGVGGIDGGSAYEDLRRRLIAFFRHHVPAEAEALADVALDRLARRIGEGVEVDDTRLYALGIARNVLLEARARVAQHERAVTDPTVAASDADDDEVDPAMLAALRRCLARLGPERAQLIVAYYEGDGAQRIETRRRLAATLAIALNTLRNRALRLREELEDCVRTRLAARARVS